MTCRKPPFFVPSRLAVRPPRTRRNSLMNSDRCEGNGQKNLFAQGSGKSTVPVAFRNLRALRGVPVRWSKTGVLSGKNNSGQYEEPQSIWKDDRTSISATSPQVVPIAVFTVIENHENGGHGTASWIQHHPKNPTQHQHSLKYAKPTASPTRISTCFFEFCQFHHSMDSVTECDVKQAGLIRRPKSDKRWCALCLQLPLFTKMHHWCYSQELGCRKSRHLYIHDWLVVWLPFGLFSH